MARGDNSANGTCFACDRKLGAKPALVRCSDEQTVFVGVECFRKIKAIAELDDAGYQPPLGGPRLFLITDK